MRLSILILTALTSIASASAGGESEGLAIPKPRLECPPCCAIGGGKASCDLAICNECRHNLPPPGTMTIMNERRAIPTPPILPEPRPVCPPCCRRGCKLALCNKCDDQLPPPGTMTIMKRIIPTPPPDTAEEAISGPFEECPECCRRTNQCRLAVCNEPVCRKRNVLESREPEPERHSDQIEARDEQVLPVCPPCCATKTKHVGCMLADCDKCIPRPGPIPDKTPI